MKTGFKDPIAIRKQYPKDHPKDGQKEMGWDYTCPQYDQRSSGFVKAGTCYDVGHRQPVGHKGQAKMKVDVLPYGMKIINQQIPEHA
jgi:hypothetical protein